MTSRRLSELEKEIIVKVFQKKGHIIVLGGSVVVYDNETAEMFITISNIDTVSRETLKEVKETLKMLFSYVDEIEFA